MEATPSKSFRHTSLTMQIGCLNCPFFEVCGGSFKERGVWNCFDVCSNCNGNCDYVCPRNPIEFVSAYREVNGFRIEDVGIINQNASPELPKYIPTIYDNWANVDLSELKFIAIPTFRLVGFILKENGKSELHKKLRISDDTKLLLLTIGFDKHLEKLWTRPDRKELFYKFSKLGIGHIVAPNFSLFLDAPRTDNMHNKKRSLICANEMSEVGLSTIPYLMAVTNHDWKIWQRFLEDNPSIKFVAKEFQTGGRRKEVAHWHLKNLALLQDKLKRRLHPIAIGGIKHIPRLKALFDSFTVVSSTVYLKTVKRQKAFIKSPNKLSWESNSGGQYKSLDELMLENYHTYKHWLSGVEIC